METGLNQFFDCLKDGLADARPFEARPYYSPEADTLTFYAVDAPSYAKRLNQTLTLILSTADDSVIGLKIKGVRRIIQRMKRLGLQRSKITGQTMHLKAFVEFALVPAPETPEMESYEGELTQFDDVPVDMDELQLA